MADGSAYAVTSGSAVYGAGTTETIAIVGGNSLVNGNLLVVAVSVPSATLPTTTATYDGQNMTKAVQQAGSNLSVVIWYIFNHGVTYPNMPNCVIPIGSNSKHVISWWQFAGMSEIAGTGSGTTVGSDMLRIMGVSGDNQDLVVYASTTKPKDLGTGFVFLNTCYHDPGYPFQFPAYNDDGYTGSTSGGSSASQCYALQSAMPAHYYTQKTAEIHPGAYGTIAGVPGWGVPIRQDSYGGTTYAEAAVAFRATTRRSTSTTFGITADISATGNIVGGGTESGVVTVTGSLAITVFGNILRDGGDVEAAGSLTITATGTRVTSSSVTVTGAATIAATGIVPLDARVGLLTSIGETTTSTTTTSASVSPRIGTIVLVAYYVGGSFSSMPTVSISSGLTVDPWDQVEVYTENGTADIALVLGWARVTGAGAGSVTVTGPSSDRRGLAVLEVLGTRDDVAGTGDFLVTETGDFLVTETGDFLVTEGSGTIGPMINFVTDAELATNTPSMAWGTSPYTSSSIELAVVAGRDATTAVFDQLDLVAPPAGYDELVEVGSAMSGINPHAMEAMWAYPCVGTPSWTFVPLSGTVDAIAMIGLEFALDAVYQAAYGGSAINEVVGNELVTIPYIETGVLDVGGNQVTARRNRIAAPVAMGGVPFEIIIE